MLYNKRNFEDVIKLRNLRQRWDHCYHKRGSKRLRIREEKVTTEEVNDVATSQGMWANSKSWEKIRSEFSLRASRKHNPVDRY